MASCRSEWKEAISNIPIASGSPPGLSPPEDASRRFRPAGLIPASEHVSRASPVSDERPENQAKAKRTRPNRATQPDWLRRRPWTLDTARASHDWAAGSMAACADEI